MQLQACPTTVSAGEHQCGRTCQFRAQRVRGVSMGGRVSILGHPHRAGQIRIVAIDGTPSRNATGDIATGPGSKALFHVLARRPGEVSRRTWHALRYCGGSAGWLSCPLELAMATLLRNAAQAAEEERYANSICNRRTTGLLHPEALAIPASIHRICNVETAPGRRPGVHKRGAGQALAIAGPAQAETCSACRQRIAAGSSCCTGCGSRLVRFGQATDRHAALATPPEPSG